MKEVGRGELLLQLCAHRKPLAYLHQAGFPAGCLDWILIIALASITLVTAALQLAAVRDHLAVRLQAGQELVVHLLPPHLLPPLRLRLLLLTSPFETSASCSMCAGDTREDSKVGTCSPSCGHSMASCRVEGILDKQHNYAHNNGGGSSLDRVGGGNSKENYQAASCRDI